MQYTLSTAYSYKLRYIRAGFSDLTIERCQCVVKKMNIDLTTEMHRRYKGPSAQLSARSA